MADEITSKVGKEILGRNTVLKVTRAKLTTVNEMELIIEYHNSETEPGKPNRVVVQRDAQGNYKIVYEEIIGRETAIRTNAAIKDAVEKARKALGECS